jgi:hypothetical protein
VAQVLERSAGVVGTVVVEGGETLLSLGRRGTAVLAGRPDHVLARRLTGGVRRVHWQRLRPAASCTEVSCTTRRAVRLVLPLAAGLALAEAGVPTVVSAR